MTFLTTLRTFAVAAVLAVGGLSLATPAGAATLDGTIGLQTPSDYFKDSEGRLWVERGRVSLSGVASYSGLSVGALQLVSTHPLTKATRSFVGFCVEFTQSLNLPGTYASGTGKALTSTVQLRLGRLVTAAWAKVTDARTAAAFQLAVWETIYDSAADTPYVNGNVSAASGQVFSASTPTTTIAGMGNVGAETISLANDWARAARDVTLAVAQVQYLKSDSSQDLMTYVPPEPPQPVPVPAAGVALVSGLAALAALRRRRRAAGAV